VDVDGERLGRVAQAAFDRVAGDRRWELAIARAKAQIEENPYMYFEGGALLVLSPSGNLYSAGRACQCRAYLNRRPCWHRAAARLLERYFERGT
jgi:hypothetical protein